MTKIIPLSKLFALLGSTILPPPMQQHQSEAHFRASFMILCLSLFTLLQFVTAMLCVMLCSIMFHLHTKKKSANCNFGAVGTTSVYYGLLFAKKKLCGKLFAWCRMSWEIWLGVELRRKTALNGEKICQIKKFITKDDLQWYAVCTQ